MSFRKYLPNNTNEEIIVATFLYEMTSAVYVGSSGNWYFVGFGVGIEYSRFQPIRNLNARIISVDLTVNVDSYSVNTSKLH